MRLTSSCQEPNPNYKLARSLRDDLGRGERIVILDCRGNDEYQREHIQGAYNIVLPQLLQRRLKANKLPLRNLVPANVAQEKEVFLTKVQTSAVIIYDQQSSDLNGKDTPLQLLLHNRMAHEGCRVAILKGGFSKFRMDYPEFCSRAKDSDNILNVDDKISEELEVCDGEPASTPTRYSSSVFGLEALTLTDHPFQSGNNAVAQSHAKEGGGGLLARRSRRHGHRFPGPLEICRGLEPEQQSESLSIATQSISPQSSCPENVLSDKSNPTSPSSSFPAYGNSAAPAEILPYLFLGCARDAASREILSQYDITYILNVTPNLPNVFEGDRKYHYKQIAISDHWSQNLSQFFPEAIAFIDKARSENCGVLVHCLAGISRSVTVTVAYLMQKNRWSLNDAYDFVKQKKSNVSPNFNFLGQLLDFEKTLGLNLEATDSGISSSSSSNSPPTLFFTSPPPPTPKPMSVTSSNVVSSCCSEKHGQKQQDYKTLFQASCTES